MSDAQRIQELETKVSDLETKKADKTGTINTGQVRTGVLKTDDEKTSDLVTRSYVAEKTSTLATTSYVDEKTKPASVLKTIQDADLLGGSKFVVGSIAVGSLISAGFGSVLAATLPSFFSTSDIITKWLENKFHIIRRNSGFLWKESAEQRERRTRQEGARDGFSALRDGTRRLAAIVSQLRRQVGRLETRLETRLTEQATRITRTNTNLGETDGRLAAVRTEVRRLSARSTDIRNRAQGAASVAPAGGAADDLQRLRRQVDILVAALG